MSRMPLPRRRRSTSGSIRASIPRILRFRMASRREAIAPAVERILKAVQGAGLRQGQKENLAVAVAEALSNAAVHGNRLQPGTQVRVKVAVIPQECAVVDVTDSGSGFDVTSVADPTDPARVLEIGGRGIFLMRRLVDRLEYNRTGNRVRLTMEARPRGTRPAGKLHRKRRS